MTRTFSDAPAVREAVPLLVGLVGPSGSGKTFSALRLATGMQRVKGGDIWVVDTEAKRSLHYAPEEGEKANPAAGTFNFRHLPFGEPFSSLDYLAAFKHCADKGAGIIIVDSMSHEHEGPGGLLEQHAAETARLAKAWRVSEDKAQMSAWAKPKAARRRMINTILQMPISFVFCFRAKEKLAIVRGKQPKSLGFMPVAGQDLVYEMMVRCLLMPNSDGVPTWRPELDGEKLTTKMGHHFRGMFPDGKPLSEDTGEQLARWAAGSVDTPDVDELLATLQGCSSAVDLGAWHKVHEAALGALRGKEKAAVRGAYKTKKDEVTT